MPAVGAGIGTVVGGLGAWLNSDSLAYQWERNQEKFRIAQREGAAISAALEIAGETAFCYCDDATALLDSLRHLGELKALRRAANLEDVFIKLTGRDIRD